jgi:hypothetical protein
MTTTTTCEAVAATASTNPLVRRSPIENAQSRPKGHPRYPSKVPAENRTLDCGFPGDAGGTKLACLV